MKTNRGDVVLLDHPFSDASGSKVRPVLIVQSDVRNAKLKETIIAIVTSNLKSIANDSTQILIDITTTDGMASGLRNTSVVKCGKLYTVSEDHVIKKLGKLSKGLMDQVSICLKDALDLP